MMQKAYSVCSKKKLYSLSLTTLCTYILTSNNDVFWQLFYV